MAKNPRTSARISVNLRVLYPFGDLMVLPCMGSHDHTTDLPCSFSAFTSGGNLLPTLSAPMREISVRRPGSLVGLSVSHKVSRSSTVMLGPTLQPTGLPIPRKNSTCAPPG